MVKWIRPPLALVAALVMLAAVAGPADAARVPRLKHVWVFVMENHSYDQIIGSPHAPYTSRLALNFALQFPSQWFAFLNPGSGATQQQFSFVAARSMLPANLTIEDATEIYAELQLAAGRSLGGTLTATLTIGSGSRATTQTLTFDNKTTALLPNLSIANWVDQPWTLTVTKAGVPPGIKDPTTELIDPTALLTIGMIVTYGAARG